MNPIFRLIHERPGTGMVLLLAFLFAFIILFGAGFASFFLFVIGFFANNFLNRFMKNFFKHDRPRKTPQTMDYSFPSFHAQITSYISAFFFLQNPLTVIVTVPIYFIVVYQRISGKHHYPRDVAVGTFIGVCLGFVFSAI